VVTSVATRYRESRVGRLHVHVVRFVALLSVMSLAGAVGYISLSILRGSDWFLIDAGPVQTLVDVGGIAVLGVSGLWLPAAILTVAWAGWEGGEP